jgi:minor extracellular serine protease Vpr
MRNYKLAVVVVVLFALLVSPIGNMNAEQVIASDTNRFVITLADYSRFPNSESLTLVSHSNFKANLALNCPGSETVFEFNTGMSGFSVECSEESIRKISGFSDVKSVSLVRYVYPHMFESIETTGAVDVWEMRDGLDQTITGKDVLVGIIDTGIHSNHPSLGGGFGPDYKVCVGYDFYDLDVNPYPIEGRYGYHGSHVAGIVAATGMPGIASDNPTPKGIAPDAKLGAYKVFGGRRGAPYDSIMMALERAFEDGCDVVNLSLGSEYVWAEDPYCRMIDGLVDKGMVVVASAGNAGRNSREDLPFQVGSPGGAVNAICVAAMNDTGTVFFNYGDEHIEPAYMSYSKKVEDELRGELAYCELGSEEEVEDLDLDGAIALVKRGDLTFYDKAKNVQEKGAVACIVFNNREGAFGGTLGVDDIEIPVFAISDELGEELMDYLGEECSFEYENHLGLMAQFSSAGPTNDYRLKPDMSAPGKDILSTVGSETYMKMSGTSMSSPMVAGGAALVIQAHPDWSAHDVRSALINYSAPQVNLYDSPHSILSQGTGRMYLPASVNAEALFFPTSLSPGWISEPVEQTLQIKNVTDSELTLYIDLEKEGGVISEFGEIVIPVGATKEYTFTLGKDAKEGMNTGYLLFNSGDQVARVAYLYYLGEQPEVEMVSHLEVLTPAFSPNNDEELDYFRGSVSYNKPMAGMEYLLLDENHELEKILWYNFGYISGGMWDFYWDGLSDDTLISDGKHYFEFYTLDFNLDPGIRSNWERQGELEFFVTTTSPEIELVDMKKMVYNEDEYIVSGMIYEPLLDFENMGDDGLKVAMLYGNGPPAPIELSGESFEFTVNLSPGKNSYAIYIVNAGGIEAVKEFSVMSLSKMEIKLEENLIADDEPTSIEIVTKDGIQFVEAESIVDIPEQIEVKIDRNRIHVSVGESSVTMMVGQPLMIADGGVAFCEPPYIEDEKIMIPIVDLLEGLEARYDEKESVWTLIWIAKPE